MDNIYGSIPIVSDLVKKRHKEVLESAKELLNKGIIYAAFIHTVDSKGNSGLETNMVFPFEDYSQVIEQIKRFELTNRY